MTQKNKNKYGPPPIFKSGRMEVFSIKLPKEWISKLRKIGSTIKVRELIQQELLKKGLISEEDCK
jgi:hypothetical protein